MPRPGLLARLVLLLVLVALAVRHLTNVEFWSPFSGLIFGTHELGHLLWAILGEWMGVAGGSLTQLLLPALTGVYFARVRHDRFAVAVCGVWLAISLANLAAYIGDARAESLDLVSFNPDGGVHDWNYLLHTMGLLRQDREIAGFARFLGWMVLALCALLGVDAARGARPAPAGNEQGAS